MIVVMLLLGVVYAALMAALYVAGAGAIGIILIAGGFAAFQFFASDKLALSAMGARIVTPQEAPQLHAMIERLCVQADLPKPRVAVVNTRMPNAFAIGRSPKHATVCATTGIMELLSPTELEGVMAHELTHVKNRDVAIMTLAGFFATIAAYIVQFGFLFGGGGGYGDDDDNASFMVLFLVSLAVYVISFLLMQALSRYREFAADRGAAIITGAPERARLGADEDLQRHAPDPAEGPARLLGAGGVLHLPARRQERRRRAVLDPSADGEAHRGARAPRGPAPGHRVVTTTPVPNPTPR